MEQAIEEQYTLQSLPLDVFSLISSQLSPLELAALSVQNRRLRDQAVSDDLWRPHCLKWWPQHAATAVELYYCGDWHKMFCSRASMLAAFPAAVDKIHALTIDAKESNSTLPAATAIEEILRGVEAAKRAVQMKPSIKYTVEFENLRIDISWWLEHHPQGASAAVKFAKTAVDNFYVSTSTGQSRISSICDAEWKLDALEGMSSLALEQRVHVSVKTRLKAEILALRRLVEARA